jgi:hypothetical protein
VKLLNTTATILFALPIMMRLPRLLEIIGQPIHSQGRRVKLGKRAQPVKPVQPAKLALKVQLEQIQLFQGHKAQRAHKAQREFLAAH